MLEGIIISTSLPFGIGIFGLLVMLFVERKGQPTMRIAR